MAATKRRKVSQRDSSAADDDPEYPNHEHEDKGEEDPNTAVKTTADDDDPEEVGPEEEEEGGEPSFGEDDISQLLEPLTREQLVSLLRAAAATDPSTLAKIRHLADLDPSYRKIFVHGLNWSTSADTLRSYFSQYGDIDDCRVVTDRNSGKSKGYGFVLFRRRSSAREALSSPQKLIDGRMTACQLASMGPAAIPPPSSSSSHHHHHHHHHPHSSPDTLSRKIYVGNVHSDIDGGRLLEFFSRYGEIEEGPLGFDRHTGRPKGFALFIYRTQESARKALEEPNKNFEGHLLYCQKATDSQRRAAAAAAAPSTPTGSHGGSGGGGGGGYALQAPPGFSVPAGAGAGGYNGMMDVGSMAQGIMGGQMAAAFGQGMPANAALAMLAAAGQNPAAYGVPPALFASLNPAFAAAMSGAAPPMAAMQAAVPAQGYGMATAAGYQGASYQVPAQAVSNQGGVTYQAVPITQTQGSRSQMGSMSGYSQH